MNGEPIQKTVLVADDSPLIRKLVQAGLTNRGYEVIEAEDGVQAVELAGAERPDAIVLDRQMPKMDGFEVVRRLRDDETTRAIPIVMLSEDADDDALVEHVVDEFLPKPFEPEALASALARVTGGGAVTG